MSSQLLIIVHIPALCRLFLNRIFLVQHFSHYHVLLFPANLYEASKPIADRWEMRGDFPAGRVRECTAWIFTWLALGCIQPACHETQFWFGSVLPLLYILHTILIFHATAKDIVLERGGCYCVPLSWFILIPACSLKPFNGNHNQLAQTFFSVLCWSPVRMRGADFPKTVRNSPLFVSFLMPCIPLLLGLGQRSAFHIHTHEWLSIAKPMGGGLPDIFYFFFVQAQGGIYRGLGYS
jgi:hypothetical protein